MSTQFRVLLNPTQFIRWAELGSPAKSAETERSVELLPEGLSLSFESDQVNCLQKQTKIHQHSLGASQIQILQNITSQHPGSNPVPHMGRTGNDDPFSKED